MAEIEGTVTLDSVAAEVPVIALSAEKIGGEYQILASTVSAADGTYGLDPGGSSIVVALGGNGGGHGAVSVGTLWTPAEITTALWLDAADASTITESGGAVSQWDDKSGNARHAVGTGHAPQTGADTINSLNVMSFNGASQYFDLSGLDGLTGGATAFVVLKVAVDPPVDQFRSAIWYLRSSSLPASSRVSHYPFNDGVVYDSFGTTVRKTTGDPTVNLSTPHMYGVKSISGEWTSWINAIQHYTTAINTFGIDAPMYFGHALGQSGFFYYLNGVVGEIVVLEGGASTGDRQLIEGYLAWKWGLEANLPSGHPYESAAPTV